MRLELEPQEVQAIIDVLGQMPHNKVHGLINKVMGQAQEQTAEVNAQELLAEKPIEENGYTTKI